MTGIILSGGEGRRMTMDKAFLKIDGMPLIEKILSVLDGLFEEVIIVTNKPEGYISYNTLLVGDLVKGKGPLSGLYSGLLNSRNNYNFVVACDMPFLERPLISFMMGLTTGEDIVIPMVKGHVEPLHAIYSKSCLYHIEKALKGNDLRLRGLLEKSNVRYVEEDEIKPFDPDMRSFININTPEDLEKVRRRL